MTKVCALCGGRVESSVCTNSLCRGFGNQAASRSDSNQSVSAAPTQTQSTMQTVEPYDSPQGTTIPRHIAGVLDNVLAWFFSIPSAKLLTPDSGPVIQCTVVVLAYLGYFFVFEALFSTTPAKFMNGLVVRNFAGGRCTLSQTLVRTLFRLIEVNPLFLGRYQPRCVSSGRGTNSDWETVLRAL